MDIAYPMRIDGRGRTGDATRDEHIRQMIEQLLFTAPGERVNRPDFGTGVMQLVFAPNNKELATATEFMIQGALQQWLGEVIKVESVQVEAMESSLRISIQYVIRRTQQRSVAEFSREI
jgi:phage baseplate assembly protein W